MNTITTSHHLEGTEEIRLTTDATNHVAIYIEERYGHSLGLILGDRNADNAAWLRKLAAAALDLADAAEKRQVTA